MRLTFQSPQHECSRCTHGFSPGLDGQLMWKDEDGNWKGGCPWPDLEEAVPMLRWNKRLSKGHTPVTFGWTSVVPRLFVDAMDAIDSVTNECEAELMEKRRASG